MMDDLIWRTDVVNYIEEYGIIDGYEDTQNCIRGIKALPSAQPERKTGRWIDDNCSECGQYVFHGDARNFCPNCGAKMENDL